MCTSEMLFDAAKESHVRGYKHLMQLYRDLTGIEVLDLPDKKTVSAAAALLRAFDANATRQAVEHTGVAMFTAYTSDYSVGYACEIVNRMYAARHGYEFHSDVLPYDDMMAAISPRQFCGWYKVLMIQRFLADMAELRRREIGYIMWIDADAVVVNHSFRVQELIERSRHRDLIISEDVNPCCLVNTGVVIVRVSSWSEQLWTDVWAMRKYFDVFFYEQSALVRCLKARLEGLDAVQPFHSYVRGGPHGDKLFAHTMVTGHLDLNSNRCQGLTVHVSDDNRKIDTSHANEHDHHMAKFIFHCADKTNDNVH
ncbi:hypothetical protein DYB25_009272 [Aphanomyces astaci]|uniref:Nucleotide-diphospho-sugar transferase domain-containing protein n=1 Tax=Aphanomyces astaci TaxID=112090 RepID=A0A397AFC7_APHAT|nr:hypothetical protein DYB25_009272 [Aphanomyces astaci]